MRQIATVVDIAATPARVWEVLTDLPHYSDWNPFIREASGEVAPGARLRLRTVPARGRPVTFRPRIRTAVPQRELSWMRRLVLPGLFDGLHRFVLTDLDGGGTRVVQDERFTGVLVPALAKAVARTTEDFDALNRALRKRCEAVRV
ncbi:SRPBCC family protein [Streptomyces sp. NPDC001404]|uniref:SRPBCC family protein n=1 Tax=Streptomyces sp. NPDC001404 TaxID=3364571 RepID=UPI0036864023